MIHEHRALREKWLPLEEQKKFIKGFWGDKLVKFIGLEKTSDEEYIVYLVRR